MEPIDFEIKWNLRHEQLSWLTDYSYDAVTRWFKKKERVPSRVKLWLKDLDELLILKGYEPGTTPIQFLTSRNC